MSEGPEAERQLARREIAEGLSASPRTLPSRFFYDDRGSRLFERITRLPAYYLTDAERALLRRHVAAWIEAGKPASLVELGAGSAEKTRIILDAMTRSDAATYVPVDVSAEFLRDTARRLSEDYPSLRVRPAVGDMRGDVDIDPPPPPPIWFALLGSTLGNFHRDQAVELLATVAERMAVGDRFLLGLDLVKDRARLETAYNDPEGVTAEFNLNILRVVNRLIDTDFDPSRFDHRAVFLPDEGRIEMHLVSRDPQRVHLPGVGAIELEAGEAIRSEVSHKYHASMFAEMAADAGLRVDRWEELRETPYALVLLRRATGKEVGS